MTELSKWAKIVQTYINKSIHPQNLIGGTFHFYKEQRISERDLVLKAETGDLILFKFNWKFPFWFI